MKKFAVFVMICSISWAGIALAESNSIRETELERTLSEMSGTITAMQNEIEVLKHRADGTSEPAAAASEPTPDWPHRVTLNGRVRIRGYNLQNMWDYNNDTDGDSWNTFRTYGALQATVKATEDVTAVVKVADQTYGNGVTGAKGWEEDNKGNKIFLDNAYVNVNNIFGAPVDLTIGRQNLIYGSGFVVFDGNSQFASTNQYFDGVKLTWHLTPGMALDAFFMNDEENNRDNASHDDIHLSGVYLTGGDTPAGKPELYVFNRSDQALEKDIWVFGGRVSNKLDNGLDYSLEAALQTGDALPGVDQEAFGAKTEAGYTFKSSAMTPRVYAGLTYLSGDDPSTEKNEGWDVMYGGWPQFGDLLAWVYVNIGSGNALSGVYNYNRLSSTGAEAVFSNLGIATFGGSLAPFKNVTVSASYSNLTFNETYAGGDKDFGDYFQATLKYQYNKQLSFRIYSALLAPGNAFDATEGDNASEVFWETDFKF